jgi:hypothetical protein
VRVAAARVGQHEQARAVHRCFLESRLDERSLGVAEHAPQRAVHRHANERDDPRTESIDLLLENLPALEVLGGLQHVDARAGARDQVGHADAPCRQPHVIQVRHRFGHDPRFVEQTPEAIRRSREVMPGSRRHHTRIYADQEHAHARLDAIRQSQIVPGGLRILGHELVV